MSNRHQDLRRPSAPSRRRLRAGLGVALGLAVAAPVGSALATSGGPSPGAAPATGPSAGPATAPGGGGRTAKNIILLVGDGMGVSHIDAARQRYHGAAGRLNMERLPNFGSVTTYAVEQGSPRPELVTDSASSATAWSSGVKTYNAALGKDTNGRVVGTIMEQLKAAGYRTGNVSTAEITDATPAGMVSHVSSRGCQGPRTTGDCTIPAGQPGAGRSDTPIAEQIAQNGTADVILGGGLSRFEPSDARALRRQGYRVLGSFGDPAVEAAGAGTQSAATQRVATREELARVRGRNRRVIGLFNRGNLTVEKYKRENPGAAQAREPSLPEMTDEAIRLLGRSDQARRQGFFLQVEGALIDKRSHANDAAQTLEEVKAFDDAVARARAFAERDGETLVIVTADHECAGFNIVGKGSSTNAEATAPPVNVDPGNPANSSTPTRGGGGRDPGRSPSGSGGAVVPSNSAAGAQQPGSFAPATFRTPDDPADVRDGSTDASLWLSYLSGNHTGADVNIYAYGPRGATFDEPMDNTHIYGKMKWALGR